MAKENKITYLSEIKQALIYLGGSGSLKEINQVISKRDKLPAIHTNPNWTSNVSAEIQRHCKDTKSYNGSEDIFYSVYGLGEGFWRLKNFTFIESPKANIEKRICNVILENTHLNTTEKQMIIKARNGQGIFRDKIISKYHKCIITGISDKRLLIASHIHPWRSANNEDRLSEENGLSLSPLYDKLFDKGLISFNKDMKLIISKDMQQDDIKKIGFNTDEIYIHSPSQELKRNMEYHRDKIFKR